MNSKLIIAAVAVLIVIGASVFFMNRPGKNTQQTNPSPTMAMEEASSPTPNSSTSATPGDAMMNESGVKEITVTASNFKFSPTEIKVNKGDKVKIILKNTQGFHDLVIDEFNVQTKSIGAGLEDTVEFTADKAGTFEYYCSIGNHRAMGMVGKLIVQ